MRQDLGASFSKGIRRYNDEINRAGRTLYNVLSDLGLTSGLQICLDAGDRASWNGGQQWLDTSGNGQHFFQGATIASAATDPTFNGTPGGLSLNEYFSFDGGDFFRYHTSNPTWVNNLHRDNAIYTFLFWQYSPDVAASVSLVGSNGGVAGVNSGVHLAVNAPETILLGVATSGTSELNIETTGTVPINTWCMVSASVNEATGANGVHIGINASFEAFTSTYASPAAVNATYTLEIGARGNSNLPADSGSRIGMAAIWSGVKLTTAELEAIYQATRHRYQV